MTGPAPRVIAIDGPAASGKSSTGLAVARALGWCHLDSGSLYRGLTRVALDLGQPHDPAAILAAAAARGLGLERRGDELVVVLDGQPAETRIRTPEVAGAVSAVSAIPGIRAWATDQFRSSARRVGATVLDGRDIGTVVFPDAPLKVFLTATPSVRARRRLRQGGADPRPAEVAVEADRLAARDAADSTRAVAPLVRPAGAVEIDTSDLPFAEQVDRIVALARRIWLP